MKIRVKTNPYKMVAQKARPHSGRADVIIRVVEIVLGFSFGEVTV